MIISYSHRFIFIHTHKTAGTSIKSFYHPYREKCDLVLGGLIEDEKLSERRRDVGDLWKHSPAKDAAKSLGHVWEKFLTFSFVRNPWDRCVSHYFWWLSTPYRDVWGTYEKVRALKDFNEYVEKGFVDKITSYSDSLCDEKGRILVDFVGRYENLNNDFMNICKAVNLPSVPLPKKNSTDHMKYTEYYSDKNIERVAELFADDIKLFDYKFGED